MIDWYYAGGTGAGRNEELHKDLKAIKKQAEDQGFTTRVTSKGHLRVFKDGVPVTTFSGTPSDGRSWKNSMAAMKRAGFDPNKK